LHLRRGLSKTCLKSFFSVYNDTSTSTNRLHSTIRFPYSLPAHISDGVRETGCFSTKFPSAGGICPRSGIEPGEGQGLKAFVSIIFPFSLAHSLICLLACEEVHEDALHLRYAFVCDAGLLHLSGMKGLGIATYDAFSLLLAGSCCNLKIDRWVVKWGLLCLGMWNLTFSC
jgi:hypothetical protein